jgi:hypothetical protein
MFFDSDKEMRLEQNTALGTEWEDAFGFFQQPLYSVARRR